MSADPDQLLCLACSAVVPWTTETLAACPSCGAMVIAGIEHPTDVDVMEFQGIFSYAGLPIAQPLERVYDLAKHYVSLAMADNPAIIGPGTALHDLAVALRMIPTESHEPPN